MVDDAERRSAEDLRDIAAKLKLLAERTRSFEARNKLLEFAEHFERMARRLEMPGP
jgi:hypothetical protein